MTHLGTGALHGGSIQKRYAGYCIHNEKGGNRICGCVHQHLQAETCGTTPAYVDSTELGICGSVEEAGGDFENPVSRNQQVEPNPFPQEEQIL